MKLRKIGGAELAVLDRPEEGIRFGYEDLWIKLRKGPDAKVATSRYVLFFGICLCSIVYICKECIHEPQV